MKDNSAIVDSESKGKEEPLSSNTLQTIKFLQDMLEIPAVRSVIERELLQKGTLRSTKPYYTEKFARELEPILLEMMEDGKDREFPYELYSKTYSKHTLYQKVSSSLKFLVDHDQTGKLREFRDNIEVQRGETGVMIRHIRYESVKIIANVIDPQITPAKWKVELHDFLENSTPGKVLTIVDVLLEPDEIDEIEALVEGNDEYLAKITRNQIKIIHLKEEDQAK